VLHVAHERCVAQRVLCTGWMEIVKWKWSRLMECNRELTQKLGACVPQVLHVVLMHAA